MRDRSRHQSLPSRSAPDITHERQLAFWLRRSRSGVGVRPDPSRVESIGRSPRSRCSGTGCRRGRSASRASDGFGPSATAAMIIPGVQMPHCAPPCSTNARCSGWRPPSPSIVVTRVPATCASGHQARVHRHAVDQHRAGAALPFAAAFLGAGQPAVLAQHVEQPRHRMRVDDVTRLPLTMKRMHGARHRTRSESRAAVESLRLDV